MKPNAAVFLICLFTLPCHAAENYFTVAGSTWRPNHTATVDNSFNPVNVSYGSGWSAGGAVGVAYNAGRLETELTYHQAEAKGGGDMWALAWMLNAWFDLHNSSPLTPYAGGGIGLARGRAASPGPVDNTGHGGAYQIGSGFAYKLTQHTSLDLGYRYLKILDAGTGGVFNLSGSSLIASVRTQF